MLQGSGGPHPNQNAAFNELAAPVGLPIQNSDFRDPIIHEPEAHSIDTSASLDDTEVSIGSKPTIIQFEDDLEKMFVHLISLLGIQISLWTPDHASILLEFSKNNHIRKLILYVDLPESKLVVSHDLPTHHVHELVYVIRNKTTTVNELKNSRLQVTKPESELVSFNDFITAQNFHSKVQYGTISKPLLNSLAALMNGIYVPLFVENHNWPETVRHDFTGQLNKFMAVLTDATSQGHNILYVPRKHPGSTDKMAHNKEAIQQHEVILLHWIRQIKDVLNDQNSSETSEKACPLDEIAFWGTRCAKLVEIRDQILRKDVQEIISILERSKSSYLQQFHQLCDQIQESSAQAQENLKFLSLLTPSCDDISKAEPQKIAAILPKLMMYIRIIWTHSQYYGTKEKITNLIRKVSNQIIGRCTAKISLESIFFGNTEESIQSLQDCIRCGEQWKTEYDKAMQHIAKYAKNTLEVDHSSVFAQLDAFVQRCRDLLEICEGQMQFARKLAPGGKQLPLPIFGGAKGAEIGRALSDVEKSFEKRLRDLWEIRDVILDVKATRWHDDYSSFKQAVKDLEVVMQNVFVNAVKSTTTLQTCVDMLELFSYLAKRDNIKHTVQRLTSETYQGFLAELNLIKTNFETNRKSPAIMAAHPTHAGAAIWARGLSRRITSNMNVLKNSVDYLPKNSYDIQVKETYEAASGALEEYVSKMHSEWIVQLDKNVMTLLDTPLIARRPDRYLETKFPMPLIMLFSEVVYWLKLKLDVPFFVQEVFAKQEELRVLKENILAVVRDYNSILELLNKDEVSLFRERLRFLDRKINPGISSLTWAVKGVADYYVKECRKHAYDVQIIVSEFLDGNRHISTACKQISSTILWYSEPKKIYEISEFEAAQISHQATTKLALQKIHNNIVQMLGTMYRVFKQDGHEVIVQWTKFVSRIDLAIQESLELSVKHSLQEMSNYINGDSNNTTESSEVLPLFKVNVVLENNRIEYSPPLLRLEAVVNQVIKDLILVIGVVPCLSDILGAQVETDSSNLQTEPTTTTSSGQPVPLKRFFESISTEKGVIKITNVIQAGISSNAQACQMLIKHWDTYREIWEVNKDAFIRRYAKLKPALSTFDADINRYSEVANNVQKEETLANINFLRLDCSPLKHAIVAHCHTWQSKLTTLLNSNANSDMITLLEMVQRKMDTMRSPPQSIEDLTTKIQLVNESKSEIASIESSFASLNEPYTILEKYEVQIKEEDQVRRETLPKAWAEYKLTIADTDIRLKEHKEKFRVRLLTDVDEFQQQLISFSNELRTKGPFDRTMQTTNARGQIANFIHQIKENVETEERLRQGLLVFGIEHTPAKDLPRLRDEMEILDSVWILVGEWESLYSNWKEQQFLNMDVDKVNEVVQNHLISLNQLQKGPASDWNVLKNLKEKVDRVSRILPILIDLRNPALRQRHWEQLVDETGQSFDLKSPDCSLDKVLELGLDQFAESISSMSSSATNELSIEQGIGKIKDAWTGMEIGTLPYKEKYFRFQSTDSILELLEDNQLTLSSMKASKYYAAFEQPIDFWEKTLTRVLETLEMLLQVQKQWMYLENIFVAEEITKQLPKESAMFEIVNKRWNDLFASLNTNRSIIHVVEIPGLLDLLHDMTHKLEKVQKSLDMYLETKRQFFPRFYFLSNDDLLGILGQSRDPTSVQTHIKKCFDGVNKLELQESGPDNKKYWEAIGMHALDGEYVPFNTPLRLNGPVETWLQDVEHSMRRTLHSVLVECLTYTKKSKRDKWLSDWPGQILILSGQISWTADCVKALHNVEKGEKYALKDQKKKHISLLKKLADLVRTNLSKVDRKKLVALITTEVHSRDVIDRMIKNNIESTNAFEWLSQLRFYWDKEQNDCIVCQTNTRFKYDFEFISGGRLVITPLTDRCFMTLTTALHMCRGGSPQGIAGTGKTETVKDLGKAMGKFVVVHNCSSDLDYKIMGRMFSGLAQTGVWGCFDEFNRIDVGVLSVVALQISCILNGIQRRAKSLLFQGQEIKLNSTTGIFVTLNPTYAGRVALPDNLKYLFRPVAMMSPDTAIISEIMLFAEGFNNTKTISMKIDTLYKMLAQQMSKQNHYDFGLRALTSALRAAGLRRRQDFSIADEAIIVQTMVEMNTPKLTFEDVPIFMGILNDLFPGVDVINTEPQELKEMVIAVFREMNLQVSEVAVQKVIQLHNTLANRHAVMIVGQTCVGKSTCWNLLQQALNNLKKINALLGNQVLTYVLNPKAFTLGELYGEFNHQTNEWKDGVLSNIVRSVCVPDNSGNLKWVVFDGPIDTVWIESMNSLMDDNKMLTLANGERIALPETASLIFEVDDLSAASPATVSRCGVIYMDYAEMGWKPIVTSWIQRKTDSILRFKLSQLTEKYIPLLLNSRRCCNDVVFLPEHVLLQSLTVVFDSISEMEQTKLITERVIEMFFLFSIIWVIGGPMDKESRIKFDISLREIDGQFPSRGMVFDYVVSPEKESWILWETQLSENWRYPSNIPFYKILVPTVDTLRIEYLAKALIKSKQPLLVVGDVGVGKTALLRSTLAQCNEQTSVLSIPFSAQTSTDALQKNIEGRLEKRTKSVFVPVGGKPLILFIDDLNMPQPDEFKSQAPLEFLRHWMDYGCCFDKQKQTIKYMNDMQIVAAMSGGRNAISPRVQSRFNIIHMAFPNENSLARIYSTIINQKLQDFDEELKPLGDILTRATIDIFETIAAQFMPTPTKLHYTFNLRDISRIFQGLLRSHKDYYDSKDAIIKLWAHEIIRNFHDRLVEKRERVQFFKILDEKMNQYTNTFMKESMPASKTPLFGNFLGTEKIYQELINADGLKKFFEKQLQDYNTEPGYVQLDIVIFKDAVEHICRIIRVLGLPNGHLILFGVGGSGRQSLSLLAAYIAGMKTFQIQLSSNYSLADYREELKTLYRRCGCDGQETVFLISDDQIVDNAFLEDCLTILNSEEVPNIFTKEELVEIQNAMQVIAINQSRPDSHESLLALFLERVRNNLHVILCLSPVGDAFRDRIRMFPTFVNCSHIDWFSEWSEEALLEVAQKHLNIDPLGETINTQNIAKIFTAVHMSVAASSQKMQIELGRYSYVTPINYLELVNNFCTLYRSKSKILEDLAHKLLIGIKKLDETRESIQKISIELEVARKQVAQFQRQCEEYLVVIVQQKREADEQAKQVQARSEKLQAEEDEVKIVADAARVDLDQALPALEDANKALEYLNKKDMNEIRSYAKPPPLVEKVMEAVMILKRIEPTWDEAKRQVGNPNFIKQLIGFDKENISDKTLKRITQYCQDENFHPEIVGKVSDAAKSLCIWVRAMETFANIYRAVAPKRERLRLAQETLEKKQTILREAKGKLEEIHLKLSNLQQQYDEKLMLKEKLKKDSDMTELKLSRAEQLVSGLIGEKSRWEVSIKAYKDAIGYLPGDCLLAAAFVSYSGPLDSSYRQKLLNDVWFQEINSLNIACSPEFDICSFLANEAQIRTWNTQGLPSDTFSIENAIIVTNSERWPLLIDPQSQASMWLKKLELNRGLKVLEMKQTNMLNVLENSIRFGVPVLLEGVMDRIDPVIQQLLDKKITKKQEKLVVRLGDKDVELNSEFKLYLATKLANPHYTPEIFAKTAVVNFSVKEKGLEEQLLGVVVQKEKPELEDQKNKLVANVSSAKKQLLKLEDDILELLGSSEGLLLNNEKLVDALKASKNLAEQVSEQLIISQKTEADIDQARERYRPIAARASVLYFSLKDLSTVDPMYQFSLEAYVKLFEKSISSSKKSDDLDQRIELLNQFHTYSVYKYACRGLFEKDKLLFSFHMTTKILCNAGKLDKELYDFFLRGGVVMDREAQAPNLCSEWLNEVVWDNICILSTLSGFRPLISSLEELQPEWKMWFMTNEPETQQLPGEWQTQVNEFQRIAIIRAFRPERVMFCARSLVTSSLGQIFTDPPILDLQDALNDSSYHIPLLFIVSGGADPISSLIALTKANGMEKRFHHLPLGQGQAPKAIILLREGIRQGNWVYLANCHLSMSWMPTLEKFIESIQEEDPHPDFRLWLSSSPHPKFPLYILHASIKMTTEPPNGLRANMLRLYSMQTDESIASCRKPNEFKCLLFGLSFFHSVVLERKKFLTLGWNNVVDFNDSDYEICVSILSQLLNDYNEIPWDALRYLIAEANYGGRVTDDWDRRVLKTYISSYICPGVITQTQFKLSSLPQYFVPNPLENALLYRENILRSWPAQDRPEAFGQHPNADIDCQVRKSNNLLSSLLALQPQIGRESGVSREDKVSLLVTDLARRIPTSTINTEPLCTATTDETSPTTIALLQEIGRYNILIQTIQSSLINLQNCLKGITLMTSELEQMMQCIHDSQIPPAWSKGYPSVKNIAAWIVDLNMRIDFFREWAQGAEPNTYWLGAFTHPNSFLMAVLQRTARKLNVSIDSLVWECSVMQEADEDGGNGQPAVHGQVSSRIEDGITIRGVFLEGAGWDKKSNCLTEPRSMDLIVPLPPILMRAVESKRRSARGLYACPVYYYPVRTEVKGHASYVMTIDLKTGLLDSDFFIKRGTACLLSIH